MAAALTFAVALGLYLAVCVAIGAYASRRAKGDAFLTAGRGLGTALVVLSLITAWTGAGSVVGGVSFAFTAGFGYLWLAGDVLGVIVLLFLAARIRRVGRFTVPEILERRYGPATRVASALVAFVAYTAIAGTQSLAGGRLLEVAFGIPLVQGTALFAATFLLYTAFGGLLGVALVGAFQGVLMFGGLAVLLVAGVVRAGGVGAVLAAQPAEAFAPLASVGWAAGLSFHVATLLLLVSDQSTWQRFFAAKDERTAGLGARGFLVLVVLLNLFFLAIGLVARAVVPDAAPDQASLLLVRTVLGDAGAAFVYVAFAAIIMSTASAYFLSASSNLVKDVGERFLRKRGARAGARARARAGTGEGSVGPGPGPGGDDGAWTAWATRAVLVVVAVGAIALALSSPSVLRLALFSYYVYVSGVAVPVLGALFWRRATGAGALLSVVAGFAVTVLWTLAGFPFGLEPVLPALAAAVAALVVGSLATAPPDAGRVEPFAGPRATPGRGAALALGGVVAACGAALLLVAFAAAPRVAALAPLAGGAVLLAAAPRVAAARGALARRLAGVDVADGDAVASARAPWLAAYAAVATAGALYHAAFGNGVGSVLLAVVAAAFVGAAWMARGGPLRGPSGPSAGVSENR